MTLSGRLPRVRLWLLENKINLWCQRFIGALFGAKAAVKNDSGQVYMPTYWN